MTTTPAVQGLTTCNCRWQGDKLVQQCTLHEAHRDAIHEWAARAKAAEAKLAALSASQQAAQQADARDAALTDAGRDVLAERRRQVEAEGWTPEHDDEQHTPGDIARAAAAYTTAAVAQLANEPDTLWHALWPWDPDWWKPADPRRMLVKAGALILAEIERLDRAAMAASKKEGDSETR